MDLLAAWLLYPLALTALSLGLGLLVARAAGWRLPGALLLPAGFAALLALARLLTAQAAVAPFALAIVGLLALAGLVAQRRRLRALRPDPWLGLAALGVFAVFSLPIVLSGSPTLAGYLAMPDTSHQLSLAALFAEHGPDWMALPVGSEHNSLAGYVAGSYPVAAQAALGMTAPLGVLDIAWLYQPFMSALAVVMCLSLASLVAPHLRRRWQPALVAFVAAQPALVVGFALQGSIKEIAALAMLVTLVALVAAAIHERRPARSLLVAAIAAAAALGSLGPAALPYIAVAALAALVVWGTVLARRRRLSDAGWLAAAAGLAVVLSLPVLVTLATQVRINSHTLDAPPGAVGELGNLAQPLDRAQAFGIWLTGDYRYRPTELWTHTKVALVLAGIGVVLGLLWMIRRRAWGPLLLLAVLLVPSAYLLQRGNPYAEAKVLTLVSPALLMAATLGAVILWNGRWRPLGALLTAAIAAAVLASNALAYHDVSLMPHDRYAELLSVNERLAGRGPVVLTEYDEFAKYFLRDVPVYSQPEWPHGYRLNALVDPVRRPSLKTPLDPDDLTVRYMESVPYILVRRSPTASRPPASFRRAWRGEFYDLWRRTGSPEVLAHKPLGPEILKPGEEVSRSLARSWAAEARRRDGRIAYVERPRAPVFLISEVPRPSHWHGFANFPEGIVPAGPGRAEGPIRIPRTGRYKIWVEGSFARRIRLSIDGATLGTTQSGLNNPGAYTPVGSRRLTRGVHRLQVEQGGGDLRPGSGGYLSSLRHIGPIFFQPIEDVQHRVVTIDPGEWRRLVGVRADWLEIVT